MNAIINGAVGMELIDDGTILSIILILASAACFLVGVGYVALDTGLNWSGYWNGPTVQAGDNRSYALYTLYLLAPLLFLCIYFVVEAVVVVGILGEKKPMSKSIFGSFIHHGTANEHESFPCISSIALRDRTSFRVCYQRSHLYGRQRQD